MKMHKKTCDFNKPRSKANILLLEACIAVTLRNMK